MEEQESSIFPERPPVYGTFWQRLGAMILDGLILAVPQYIIKAITGAGDYYTDIVQTGHIRSATIISGFISVLIGWLYMALMESSLQQASVGKLAVGLKVTDIAGNRISFARATGRHFGKIVSIIIIFIGYFMMLWDDRNQTLHDKMAGTLVVKKDAAYAS
jgi:uncharacterized RDD family membrane protein YckC